MDKRKYIIIISSKHLLCLYNRNFLHFLPETLLSFQHLIPSEVARSLDTIPSSWAHSAGFGRPSPGLCWPVMGCLQATLPAPNQNNPGEVTHMSFTQGNVSWHTIKRELQLREWVQTQQYLYSICNVYRWKLSIFNVTTIFYALVISW